MNTLEKAQEICDLMKQREEIDAQLEALLGGSIVKKVTLKPKPNKPTVAKTKRVTKPYECCGNRGRHKVDCKGKGKVQDNVKAEKSTEDKPDRPVIHECCGSMISRHKRNCTNQAEDLPNADVQLPPDSHEYKCLNCDKTSIQTSGPEEAKCTENATHDLELIRSAE